MKLPKTIPIAGHRVKLKFVALDECYGQYKHDTKEIEINIAIRDTPECLTTIRHEMMEASLLISGVGFSERYEQEPIVRCMEDVFFPAWDAFVKRLSDKIVRN